MGTPDGNSTTPTRTTRSLTLPLKLLVGALVVLAFTAGSGIATAQEGANPGNPGKSCPGENPNRGLVKSSDQANESSRYGILRASEAIGCPLPSD